MHEIEITPAFIVALSESLGRARVFPPEHGTPDRSGPDQVGVYGLPLSVSGLAPSDRDSCVGRDEYASEQAARLKAVQHARRSIRLFAVSVARWTCVVCWWSTFTWLSCGRHHLHVGRIFLAFAKN
jgi:hypothetical protein